GSAAGASRRGDRVKRREFITVLGGAAAWPLAARAQQSVVRLGYLAPARLPNLIEALRAGLRDFGYVEGRLFSDAQFFSARRRIAELAAMHRLPAMYESRDFVDDGGLISYGPNVPDLSRRAAAFVVKILNGAKASELPIEQPTKFELVINLRTAKALGL